jgi:hypothetical protein
MRRRTSERSDGSGALCVSEIDQNTQRIPRAHHSACDTILDDREVSNLGVEHSVGCIQHVVVGRDRDQILAHDLVHHRERRIRSLREGAHDVAFGHQTDRAMGPRTNAAPTDSSMKVVASRGRVSLGWTYTTGRATSACTRVS